MKLAARLGLPITGLAALGCFAVACSGPRSWSIVALGDSVPRGTNCDCKPYPLLSADDLAASTKRSVTATNDAVGGATSASVLGQLNSDGAVIKHVRAANAIEIEIGANDVGNSSSCGLVVDAMTRGSRRSKRTSRRSSLALAS